MTWVSTCGARFCALIIGTAIAVEAGTVRAEPQTCQVLDSARSRVELRLTLGALTAQGAVRSFTGSLLLALPGVSGSRVKLVIDPRSIEIEAAPQLNAVLQALLAGPGGELISFTSDRIAENGDRSYAVSGTVEQGSRRHPVQIRVSAAQLSKGQSRFRGTMRQSGVEGQGQVLAGLAGDAEYDLVFTGRASSADGVCRP